MAWTKYTNKGLEAPQKIQNIQQLTSSSANATTRSQFSNTTSNMKIDRNITNWQNYLIVSPSQINAKDIDSLMVQELNALSLDDRERVMEEIHGVHTAEISRRDVQELPGALKQFQVELENLHNKPIYDQAIQQGSQYVLDKTFRTKFLRTELYNPKKAVQRMLYSLQFAKELFGNVALQRPIQLTDLSGNAKEILNQAPMAILPGRDTAGRQVICGLSDVGPTFDMADRARAAFYMWQCLSDDEDTQKYGVAGFLFFHRVSMQLAHDMDDKLQISKLHDSFQVRKSAIHFCLPDTLMGHAFKAMHALMLPPSERSRMRCHVGSIVECYYALKSFGIPAQYLPENLNIRARDFQRNQRRWLEQREAVEELWRKRHATHPSDYFLKDIVLSPRHEDCLFGRGLPIMKHLGNVSMRKMLEDRLEQYEQAPKSGKVFVAWDVILKIQQGGGRFLKEETEHGSHWFVPVDDESARQKISIGFRDAVKRRREKDEQQTHRLAQPLLAEKVPIGLSPPIEYWEQPTRCPGRHDDLQHMQQGFNPTGLDLTSGQLVQNKRRKVGDGHDSTHCGNALWFCSRI